MDAETEVSKGQETKGDMDFDDDLDKLLLKTVSVSQANLPIATINKEIDDIANSYTENDCQDNVLDEDFLRLIERARQRRELLNQKMGKTPEAAPRKRRTPLYEDLSDNVEIESMQQNSEDSPKRQCVRGTEQEVKPDTPAIPSVQSRLKKLASQHAQWSETGSGDKEESAPIPVPRKSLSSPPLGRKRIEDTQENDQPISQRKSRFARLANNINNWEDDLSHPTIVKEEAKKSTWQPPKVTETSAITQISSPKKVRAPLPPTPDSTLLPSVTSTSNKQSSQEALTSEPQVTKDSIKNSPVRSGSRVGFNSSPKPYQPYSERTKKVSPVKSPASSMSNLIKKEESQKETKISQHGNETLLRTEEPPKTALKHSDKPLSARLANWEQKISDINKPDISFTPRLGLAAFTSVTQTPKQTCTKAKPLSTSTHGDDEVVVMRPKVRKSVDDEPTAHSVSARMSAWEQMTSANVVGDIKKVQPGDCTPIKTSATKKSPVKSSATTTSRNCSSLSPSKTLECSIKEKTVQVNSSITPTKRGLSPKNASAAMKTVQQQLVQMTQSSSVAERLRQERMVELQTIQNRWKNGILRDDEKEMEQEKSSKTESATKPNKREDIREKARADEILEMEKETFQIKHEEEKTAGGKTVETISILGEREEDRDTSLAIDGAVNICQTVGGELTKELDFASDNTVVENGTKFKAILQGQIIEEKSEEQKYTLQRTEENICKAEVSDDYKKGLLNEQMEIIINPVTQTNNLDKNNLVKPVGGLIDEQIHVTNDPVDKVVDQKEGSPEIEGISETVNFENKLASLGFTVSDDSKASSVTNSDKQKTAQMTDSKPPMAPPAPPAPFSSGKVSGKPRPNSLFNIVTQKKEQTAVNSPKNTTTANCPQVRRKVKFDDSFESDDSDASLAKKQALQHGTESKMERNKDASSEVDSTDDAPTETTENDSDFEVVLRRPRPQQCRPSDEDDDLSLSAFVPASIRRQSILPSPQQKTEQAQNLNTSFGSIDSFEGAPGAPPDFHKSTVDLIRLGQKYKESESSSSLTSQSTNDSTSDHPDVNHNSGYSPEDTEDSVDDREAIGDFLDEAMDSDAENQSTSAKSPLPVMRKRPSHRQATEDGNLPFSISEYRASRNMQILEVKQTIVRNSQYAGMQLQEENVQMPRCPPTPAPRRSVQERMRELQELVQQEQNIIMQTSNALNQCCSSTSFAGSAEQVECNRILLISCQKRQAYMVEIQRLRDTKVLDDTGPGPKGSLTISDIRLPLKKEFVTKIGTSHDTMTYYFILLLRNGPQVICTQMLSTHDPMMRGSLDFPNLIKINGITGSFKLQLEIYSMSVSREMTGKDKKKKTPKKLRGSGLSVQSPGGPMAVHTTSFSQVTSIQLTMKSLDKHCFNLERLSHLSPLHGMIYMNLKCLMEASVEERGFLTMFEDVSGFGSWHRRWCALSGNKLQFWKYPDDETRKDPMGYIDLRRCVTEKVGLISRDICARPHTFELLTVRQPQKGEKDTLISRTYNTMTTIRHMLSADTKEERIVWCNKLNQVLANIRTWQSDAMRPLPKC